MWSSTFTKPRSSSAAVVSSPTSSTFVARPPATAPGGGCLGPAVPHAGRAPRRDQQHLGRELGGVLALGPDGDRDAVVGALHRSPVEPRVRADLDPPPVEAALQLLAHVAV